MAPRAQRALELLQYLQHKGNKTLQMLLCCLKKETTHLGHKDLAAKLEDVMKSYSFDQEMVCSICKPSANPKPDTLDEIFSIIERKYPAKSGSS